MILKYYVIKKLIFFFLLYSVCISNAQSNRLFWDGRDWNRVSKTVDYNIQNTMRVKKAYLDGVLDGRLYGYLKTWAVDREIADKVFNETVDYLNTRELIKNIDNFYEDPINGYIPVPSAIIIANMYAERMPLALIKEYTDFTREWINDLILDLDTLNYSKLLEDKFLKHHRKKINQSE